MNIALVLLILFFISLAGALFSMKDLRYGEMMRKILTQKKIRGTILFMKNKIIHFHSSKSSSLSSLK